MPGWFAAPRFIVVRVGQSRKFIPHDARVLSGHISQARARYVLESCDASRGRCAADIAFFEQSPEHELARQGRSNPAKAGGLPPAWIAALGGLVAARSCKSVL